MEEIKVKCFDSVMKALENYMNNKLLNVIRPVYLKGLQGDYDNFLDEISKLKVSLPVVPDSFCITLFSAYRRAYLLHRAEEAEVSKFSLEGPNRINDLCKNFCWNKIGIIYDIKEINRMENHSIKPIILFAGGWGCGHIWEVEPFV